MASLVIEDDVEPQLNPCAVYAGNLTYATTDEDLRAFFSPHGEVLSAQVKMRAHRSLGYGIVTFKTEADATCRSSAWSSLRGPICASRTRVGP